jgi:tetratricopeptide (TPR) repeat protein
MLLSIALVCVGLSSAHNVAADTLKETWYLMRSRANMQIGNYAAAIEAYEKYLELKPNDREALKGIALAHEKQGETDKAIARFDIYLQHYPDDAEIAFKQADYLTWSRYAYRKKDAIKYLRIGLEARDDRAQRLKYARLLASGRYDLDEAVEQYEVLLKRAPNDDVIRGEYRSMLLWDDRYLAKTITEYQRLVEQKPRHFANRRQLAVLLSKEPRRIRDSASLYRELVTERSGDFTLRHEYAKVLARIDNEFEEARRQYKILVTQRADFEILDEYGALLASQSSTYPDAIAIYTRMLAARPADTEIRLRRASLYMTSKESAASALADYQKVLKVESQNVTAHLGAAQAFAWLGESDRALHHSKLALKYGDERRATVSLRDTLSKGREPRVALTAEVPWQNDGDFALRGLSLGARVSGDPSAFLTTFGAIGTERYEDENDDASGTSYRAGGQYRIDSRQRVDFELGSRAVRRVGDKQSFFFSYTQENPSTSTTYTAGVMRFAVEDSFQSLVGDSDKEIGGATRDEVFLSYRAERPPFSYSLTPSLGSVDSGSERSNSFVQMVGSVDFPIDFRSQLDTSLGYEALFLTFERDHSGFEVAGSEPLSGGYFSPQVFLDQYPYVKLNHTFANTSELEAKVGLNFQYVDDATVSGETSGGFAGSVSYTRKTTPSRYLIFKAEHYSVADRYERTFLQGQMLFIF